VHREGKLPFVIWPVPVTLMGGSDSTLAV